MQEPKKPYPPYEYQYAEKVERRYIYEFWEDMQEDRDEYDDEYAPAPPVKDISEVNLEWLNSQVPEGVSPSQIKIDFGFRTSSMAYEDHFVRFYYEVTVPARMDEFERDSEQFRRDLAQYEKDMAAYKEWVKQKQIKEMEEKLAKLKGG